MGSVKVSSSLSATTRQSSGLARVDSSTTNSSPPRRATMSAERKEACTRRAISHSTWSPTE